MFFLECGRLTLAWAGDLGRGYSKLTLAIHSFKTDSVVRVVSPVRTEVGPHRLEDISAVQVGWLGLLTGKLSLGPPI
jgi:hypothetical protein